VPNRPTLLTAAALGCVLALTGVVPAAATSTDESPLTVSFPESGARVSGGDVTFRGTVGDGDPLRQHQTRVQYVVDVSGSTSSPLQDCNGDGVRDALDDFNGDGRYGDVLDCEISAVVALNASLRTVPGSAAQTRVGLTAFGSSAAAAQMEEDDASSQFVAPGLTGDGKDVIPNLDFVASSLREGVVGEYVRRSVGTATNFDAALTGPRPPATAASASRLSTTGAQITGACAAALTLIALGAGAAALSRRPGSDADTSRDAPSA
jgi:hypothetical protein